MTKSEPGSKNTSMSVTGWISRLNIESGISCNANTRTSRIGVFAFEIRVSGNT